MSSKEWTTYRLGDICTDIAYGYTASADWQIEGPKFLRITDIQNYFINWEAVPQCPIKENDRKKYRLEIGDIVIARTGASTGSTFTLKDKIEAVFASYLIRYKINNEIANPFYIGYLLKSTKWKEYVSSIIGGSAQPGANAKQFADFDFILPNDIKVQNGIVGILSSIDEKIENNLKTNQVLEEIALTIFKEWFINFNYPSSDGSRKHSELGEVPSDWEVKTLGDVVEIKYGKDHKNLQSGNIPVYGSGGIMRFVDTALYENESILIPRKGTLSNLFFVNSPFWSVDTMFYTKINLQKGGKYLFHLLQTLNLSSMNVGTAVPSLTTEILNRIVIAIPQIEVLSKFEEIVSNLSNKVKDNLAENETLKITRDSLAPKLMSGEIALNG